MKKDASRLKCDTPFSFADNCKSVRGDNDFRRRYLFDSTCFSCFSRKIVPITLKSKDVHTVRLDRFYFLTRQTFFTLSHFFLATTCRQKMPTWWKTLLPTDLPTSTSHCQPSSFQVNKKMSRETRLKRLDKIQGIWYNKKEHSGKWVTVSPARSFFTCLNVLFVLVAGARFELTTFGLWARRAT